MIETDDINYEPKQNNQSMPTLAELHSILFIWRLTYSENKLTFPSHYHNLMLWVSWWKALSSLSIPPFHEVIVLLSWPTRESTVGTWILSAQIITIWPKYYTYDLSISLYFIFPTSLHQVIRHLRHIFVTPVCCKLSLCQFVFLVYFKLFSIQCRWSTSETIRHS